jgi:5'-phosphate synthase pdxT subunit
MKPVIGILALQGDFEAHRRAVERAGGEAVEVRTANDLRQIDGLIIPGGESTTMLKLLREENLFSALRDFGEQKPIFGTCAGTILMAREVLHPRQESLDLMDLTVERNAYGRQIDSRIVNLDLEDQPIEAVFIRAPIIRRAGSAVRVLLEYQHAPVLVEQGKHMAATFHPELTNDTRIHEHFVSKCLTDVSDHPNSGQTETHTVRAT